MGHILEAFRLADIQTYLNIRHHLARHNKTDEDVRKYLKRTKNEMSIGTAKEVAFVKCPECSNRMRLYKVNTSGGDQVPDKRLKSQWWCSFCGHSVFKRRTYKLEMEIALKERNNATSRRNK